MLSLNLMPIFRARGIDKPYTFLVKAELSPHSANVILNSKTKVFRLNHIELLCKVLVCEPNDLLLWIPGKGENYQDNHPLFQLRQGAGTDHNWEETFAKMPLKQLKEVAKSIASDNK